MPAVRFYYGFLLMLLQVAVQAEPYTSPLIVDHPTSMTGIFANFLDSVADVNGDGINDLAVAGGGKVHLYSGKDGMHVRSIANPSTDTSNEFAFSIAGLEDVDGDGKGDVLISAPFESFDSIRIFRGRAYLFSGGSGQLLHTFQSAGDEDFSLFGFSVTSISDLDGDSLPDLLIGSTGDNHTTSPMKSWGAVYAFSSATGNQLLRISQPVSRAFKGLRF